MHDFITKKKLFLIQKLSVFFLYNSYIFYNFNFDTKKNHFLNISIPKMKKERESYRILVEE